MRHVPHLGHGDDGSAAGRRPDHLPPQPLPTPKSTGCEVALNIGGQYYWRVRGLDLPADVNGVFSAASDFLYLPPSMPVPTGPADGATTAAPVLAWERLAGYSRYRVTTVKNSSGVAADCGHLRHQLPPPAALTAGDGYTWHVVGLTRSGKPGLTPATGDQGHFTAAAPSGTASLAPLAADNGTDNLVMPSMSWRPLTGASYYRVYSGVHDECGVQRVEQYDQAVPAGLHLRHDRAGRWRVRLVRGGVQLAQRPGRHLRAGHLHDRRHRTSRSTCRRPTAPCPVASPSDRGTPELSWQPVDGAGSYRVWVALDKDFTNIVRGYTTSRPR